MKYDEERNYLATFCLLAAYHQGNGVEKNESKAVELWKRSAELGCVESQNALQSHGKVRGEK